MLKSGVILLLLLPFAAAQYMYNPGIYENVQVQQCAHGDTDCDGNVLLRCVDGQWQAEQCPFGCDPLGCTLPSYDQPPVQEEPPQAVARFECISGERGCVGKDFSLCVNGVWQTQQTCSKYQECTRKGCQSLPREPVVPPVSTTVLPVSTPLPSPHVRAVEVEDLGIDERAMTSEPQEEYVPVVEPEKPKGLIGKVVDFFKGLFSGLAPKKRVALDVLEIGGPREEGMLIDLTQWYKSIPPEGITIDPVAGILSVYWLDVEDNICRGEPGVSGQPGTEDFVYPKGDEIYNMYRNDELMSDEQFWETQKSVYSLGGYDGTGAHIMHFEPLLWRIRDSGKVIKGAAGTSLPMDLQLGVESISPNKIVPYVVIKKGSDCVYIAEGKGGMSPIPPLSLGKQHETKCKVKSKINAKDILSACFDNRLEGDFNSRYLRIKPVIREPTRVKDLETGLPMEAMPST